MSRRAWNKLRPTSLRHAMELCLEYAKAVHNRGVERVAELMGLTSHWVLYKWMESGRMPANLIRSFEFACGCDYVTRWIAHSDHKLLIDIPTGRRATTADLNALQLALNEATGALLRFAQDQVDAQEVLGTVTAALESLAREYHEVAKHAQPELDFGDHS